MKCDKTIILITICLGFFSKSFGQIVFYQDVFEGGVTSAGYSIGAGTGEQSFTSNIIVDIPGGAAIRKAFMVISEDRKLSKEFIFNLNGYDYSLSQTSRVVGYNIPSSGGTLYDLSTHVVEVTNSVFAGQNSYLLTIPNQNAVADIYRCFYLVVLFESSSVINTAFSLFLNDTNVPNNVADWELYISTTYNLSYDVGLAINSDIICQTISDGEFVFIEGTPIGLIGGVDSSNGFMCAGVKGHFRYYNGTIIGLDDDIANSSMADSDGLAIINSYLGANNDTIDLRFESQNTSYRVHNNPISFQLTYTTPCDTFSVSVPNDTTVCYGETLQLNVSGGQTYEWQPSTGLSCSDCSDPIFTADSSMFYTVRIRNNDSCSVVRPLKINVNRTQIDSLILTAPDCGANNGSIAVHAHSTLNSTLSYSINNASTGSATVTGLNEGSYTLSVQDAIGCPVVDSTIFLTAVYNTVAQFALNPAFGNVPLELDAYNLSQNATDYVWYINGVYSGNDFEGFTIEDGGEYFFELVAWQYDPSCADTFSMIVWASEVIIPTAFTPNGDQDNDAWELVNLDVHFPKNRVQVFNRLGNLLFESEEGNYNINPWDGTYKGEALPVGSYYFIIETNEPGFEDFNGTVTVVLD